jgi:plasmid segregation protein ParM
MLIAGVDVGFGFTKATDGEKVAVMKSLVGEAQPRAISEDLFSTKGAGGMHVTVEGRSYFLGELAEAESRVRQFTLDQGQMATQSFPLLSVAALSQVASDRVPVNVVTGLPVGFFVEYRDRLAAALQGERKITLHEGSGRREFTLAVNRVKVIPQPYGSLVDHLFRDDGTMARPEQARKKVGVIDVGFRTTDFVISKALRHSERGSRTTDNGLAKAFSVIASALAEMSGVNVELYRLYEAVQEGTIKIRGAEYDISKVKDEVFSRLATAVLSDMERAWADDWDLDMVLLTGGGGQALYDYLKPMVRGELALAETRPDPRLANVHGFVKYGRYFFDHQGERP